MDKDIALNQLLEKGEVTPYHATTYHLFSLPLAEEWIRLSKEILFYEQPASLSQHDLAFAEGKRHMLRVIESTINQIKLKMESEQCPTYYPIQSPMPHELKRKKDNRRQ